MKFTWRHSKVNYCKLVASEVMCYHKPQRNPYTTKLIGCKGFIKCVVYEAVSWWGCIISLGDEWIGM